MSTFISYSRADSSFAVRLAKDLKSAGFDVWLDQLDIPTGARWDDEVEIALDSCKTFMIVLSPESLQSQNVKDEIGFAIDSGKDILPLRIKSGDIPFRLRRFQYVDFSKRSYQDGLKEVKGLLSATGQLPTEEVAKKPSGAEVHPAGEEVQPTRPVPVSHTTQPTKRNVEERSMPLRSGSRSRSLMIGLVALAALLVGGIIISAVRSNKPPVSTPTSQALVNDIPSLEQATAVPTTDTSQASAQIPAEQTGAFLTKFLDSKDLDDWEHFILGEGKRNQVNVSQSADGLVFNLDDAELHAYYTYKPAIYDDVVIRMKVENLGQNTNKVGLVCRKSGDTWYEFTVTGGGEWRLFDYRGRYFQLTNGGTQAIKYGKTVNEYEMRCIGNEVSLRINGQEVIVYPIKKDVYPSGQVGLSISSGAVFPIDMKVIEFEVSNGSS